MCGKDRLNSRSPRSPSSAQTHHRKRQLLSAGTLSTSLPSSSGQSAAANATQTAVVGGEQEAAEGSAQGRGLQPAAGTDDNPDFRTAFRVKYVAQDAAYLDGGRAAGLAEGMKLVVRDLPNSGGVAAAGADSGAAGDIAELEVLSVAETSAVTEIHTPKRPVKVGDLAYLSSADQQALVAKNALSATRKYPAAVSFTENDTLDDEARAEVPKPPLPSVNRARGRIGFDYMGVVDHGGSGMQSSNLGMVVRADITRINGTYWNVSGYWRGRFDHTCGRSPDFAGSYQPHLPPLYQLRQPAFLVGRGFRAHVSALGHQSRHHRRRLLRTEAQDRRDRRRVPRLHSRSNLL